MKLPTWRGRRTYRLASTGSGLVSVVAAVSGALGSVKWLLSLTRRAARAASFQLERSCYRLDVQLCVALRSLAFERVFPSGKGKGRKRSWL